MLLLILGVNTDILGDFLGDLAKRKRCKCSFYQQLTAFVMR